MSGGGAEVVPLRAGTGASGMGEAATAIRHAQARLEQATASAGLANDPMRDALAGLSAALGAMLVTAEAGRQPLDDKAWADLTRKLVVACRADFVRQAGIQSRRLALLTGLGAAVLLLGTLGGGYLWGRSTEAAEVREASGVIRAALSDGSASARAWSDAIQRNDLVGLLRRCEGRSVWAEAGGRRACAVPLWLDDVPRPAPPAPPRS